MNGHFGRIARVARVAVGGWVVARQHGLIAVSLVAAAQPVTLTVKVVSPAVAPLVASLLAATVGSRTTGLDWLPLIFTEQVCVLTSP